MPEESRNSKLEQVLADYLAALEAGQPVDQAAWLAAHPELAGDLRSFLANRAAMERLAEPFRAEQHPLLEPTIGAGSDADSGFGAADSPGDSARSEARTTGNGARRVRYFGDYELLDEIARGGMGVVYRARQLNLKRLVALKMILAGRLADDQEVRRFYAEAEAAARLDHPHIVPIFEVGRHDEQHYFSMALVTGSSLAERLRTGLLEPREAARLMALVARAIEYAHRQGVVHRDLKPSNILIDQDGQPRITDFGLSKRIESPGELTTSGQVVGTPGYMPPEQASGDSGRVGPAADIYSLGAVLYCLLTGRPPFQAANPIDTLAQVMSREPVAPRQLNEQVPRDLETICLKCLEKSPQRRYRSANDLADDLERWLRGEPIVARPVGQLERLARWCRRKPAAAALAATSVLAVLASVALAVVAWRQGELRELLRQNEVARLDAEEQRRITRLHLYASDIPRLQTAWEKGEMAALRELLDRQRPKDRGADLRGFEWDYLRRQAYAEQQVWKLSAPIRGLVVAPDQSVVLASDGFDDYRAPGKLLGWNLKTGKRLELEFTQAGERPHNAFLGVADLAFHRDGERVALVDDSSVKILDVATGSIVGQVEGHKDYLRAVAFSPTADLLATGSLDGVVKLWNSESLEPVGELVGSKLGILSLEFSPDGAMLVSAGGDSRGPNWLQKESGEIALWDVESRTARWINSEAGALIEEAKFAPDGQRIATAGAHGKIDLRRVPDGTIERSFDAGAGRVFSVAFAPSGKWLAAGGEDNRVRVWDVERGTVARQLLGHERPRVTRVKFAGEERLVSGGADGSVRLWDLTQTADRSVLGPQSWSISRLEFTVDSRFVVAGDYTTTTFYDRATRRVDRRIEHDHWVFRSALSADGAWLATAGTQGPTGGAPGFVKVWDARTGRAVHESVFGGAAASGVQFGGGGRFLAAWGPAPRANTSRNNVPRTNPPADTIATNRVRRDHSPNAASTEAEDEASGDLLNVWNDEPEEDESEELDEHESSSGRDDLAAQDVLRVWETGTWREVWSSDRVRGAAWSADGKVLVVVHDERVERVEFQPAPRIKAWELRSERVPIFAVSPDGAEVAFAEDERRVRRRDSSTGAVVGEWQAEREAPTELRYSPRGSVVAIGSRAGLTLWGLRDSIPREIIPVTRGPFCFSPDERTLATGSEGVRLWQVDGGRLLLTLDGYETAELTLAFAPDGMALAEGGGWRDENEGVYLWDAHPVPPLRTPPIPSVESPVEEASHDETNVRPADHERRRTSPADAR